MGKIPVLVGVGAFVLLVVIYFGMSMSYQNKEVRLRNRSDAQVTVKKITYDTMWKVVKQLTGLTQAQEKAFQQRYVALMKARGMDKGGNFMKWIQESNPEFKDSQFPKLANAIEGHRERFARDQKIHADIKREHDNLREEIPSNHFVGHVEELVVVTITSTKTEAVFESGKEDDVELFQ